MRYLKLIDNKFQAKTCYNDEKILRLFQTAYEVYESSKILIRYGVAFTLIGIAIVTSIFLPMKIVCLMIGTWFIVSPDFPSKIQAETALSQRNGKISMVEYSFGETGIQIDGITTYSWKQVDCLTEDKDFCYIFMNKQAAVMVEKKNINPQRIDSFKDYISEKTSKNWNFLNGMKINGVVKTILVRLKSAMNK